MTESPRSTDLLSLQKLFDLFLSHRTYPFNPSNPSKSVLKRKTEDRSPKAKDTVCGSDGACFVQPNGCYFVLLLSLSVCRTDQTGGEGHTASSLAWMSIHSRL